MKIERVELHTIDQPLVQPFRTSFGTEINRPCILITVYSGGLIGWGECVAAHNPGYCYETVGTAWHVLEEFLIPAILGQEIAAPTDIPNYFKRVRGHNLAKAGLENSIWDLFAQAQNVPLSHLWQRQRDRVEVGVSIGIQPTIPALLTQVDNYLSQGYRRIKVKIEPGWEIAPLTAIRQQQPDIRLMADANSAFTLADVPLCQQMDELKLLMIEQPLDHDDIFEHSKLQARIYTPICLDESIHSPMHAQAAIELSACRIINMKVARVGGLTHALAIHELCQQANLPMWCGGMLETGVGRAVNLHLATLPNFTLPADISATDRYYHEDIAEPSFTLNAIDSTITVPNAPGLGVEVQLDRVAKYRQRHGVFN